MATNPPLPSVCTLNERERASLQVHHVADGPLNGPHVCGNQIKLYMVFTNMTPGGFGLLGEKRRPTPGAKAAGLTVMD